MELSDIFPKLANQIISLKMEEMNKLNFSDVNYSLLEYIFTIGASEDLTFSDLADRMHISKPAVTASANKLIEKGLATKKRSGEDRRLYYLNLTDKGREVYNVSKSANKRFEELIRERLSKEEVDELTRLLAEIVKLA